MEKINGFYPFICSVLLTFIWLFVKEIFKHMVSKLVFGTGLVLYVHIFPMKHILTNPPTNNQFDQLFDPPAQNNQKNFKQGTNDAMNHLTISSGI